MANSDKNIEEVFNKEFQNFEHNVSNRVWNNLDKELFGAVVINESYSISKSFLLMIIPFSILIGSTLLIDEDSSENNPEELTASYISIEEVKVTESQIEDINIEMTLENDFPSKDDVFLIEETNGEDVEHKVVENKVVELIEIDENPSKERPHLSEKPYLNHEYFKSKESEVYSNFCITKLKKGVLIVRLKTREYGINALLKLGHKRKAEKLKKEVFDDNMKVVEAFKNGYSFSDVYFFYSSESNKVSNMNFENIILDENTLEVDKMVKLNPAEQFYMILDIGSLKIPESENITQSSYAISRALVMKDKDFEQLYRPFPFYVSASSKKNIDNQVLRLNERLHSYYNNNRGKY